MAESRRIHGIMIAGAAFLSAFAVGFVRGEKPPPSASTPVPIQTAAPAPASSPGARVTSVESVTTLGWDRVGLPDEGEAHGETPFRIAAEPSGVVLLDDENHRLLRIGHDGRARAEIRLSAHARDVAVAKDGTIFVLTDTGITAVGTDGRPRASLPLDPALAERSRSVLVSGDDVFVESTRGQISRIGDVRGSAAPSPVEVPGLPMRDGRGWLTARIPNARTGTLHVYVVERGSEAQRFSREIRPGLFVEGIPIVDSDANGVIHVVVTGTRDDGDAAMLLCIEPQRGDVIGTVDLPVRGPDVILDGKALADGGVVYSVFTREGIRVERASCP